MDSLTIELPWPDIALSPNSRDLWGAVKAKKAAKNVAYFLAKELMGPLGIRRGSWVGPVTVQYTFHPKTDRIRDDDNFAARMKASRDGIALALGINDSTFVTLPVVFAPKCDKPCVVATLRPTAVNADLRGPVS